MFSPTPNGNSILANVSAFAALTASINFYCALASITFWRYDAMCWYALCTSKGEPFGGVATSFTLPSRASHATPSTVSGVLGVHTGVVVAGNFLSWVLWVGASDAAQCTDVEVVKDRKYAWCKSTEVRGSCAAYG